MITVEKQKEKFKILNLTDTQISYNDIINNTEVLQHCLKTIDTLITTTQPNLITISGDLTYGDNENYQSVYKYYVNLMENYKIPFSVVWGNHDNQGGKDNIKEAVKILSTSKYFLYESGSEELGNGNYVINIKEKDNIVFSIIMMDTHDREEYNKPNGEKGICWAKLNTKQITWYEEQVNNLKKLNCNNSMLIEHIPIYAYRQAFEDAFNKEYNSKENHNYVNYKDECWNKDYKDSFGINLENICSYNEDDNVMDVITKHKHTKIIISGHDHKNCSGINYKGVLLMYGLKTGRGCYFDQNLNGGTLITINSLGEFFVEHKYV